MELSRKRIKLDPVEKSQYEVISSEQEGSSSSESEQTTLFDESQKNRIKEFFPDFERDIHFGGYERLIHFDSEFSHEEGYIVSFKV